MYAKVSLATARTGMSGMQMAFVDDFEFSGIKAVHKYGPNPLNTIGRVAQGNTFLKGFTLTDAYTPAST